MLLFSILDSCGLTKIRLNFQNLQIDPVDWQTEILPEGAYLNNFVYTW